MGTRLAINGFGRIGRTIARAALRRGDIEIVAVNDLTDVATLAHLFKYDSVHGKYAGTVVGKEGAIEIDGRDIKVISQPDARKLPWGELGADLVLECTGRFRGKSDASVHLEAGAKKVIISAPGKGVDVTVVMGVNEAMLDKANHTVISCGSCTTNSLAPLAKVLHENLGIKKGLMTTIHSYTSDQRLLDAPHSDMRRARSAALSMIPTSTGAAVAVAEVLPALKGRLDGMAVRVPTPNVSLTDFTFEADRDTTAEEVNELIRTAAHSNLKGIVEYLTEELVSIDINGNTHSSVFDPALTRVQGGNLVKVLSWYDNESGFSNRMCDLSVLFAG